MAYCRQGTVCGVVRALASPILQASNEAAAGGLCHACCLTVEQDSRWARWLLPTAQWRRRSRFVIVHAVVFHLQARRNEPSPPPTAETVGRCGRSTVLSNVVVAPELGFQRYGLPGRGT